MPARRPSARRTPKTTSPTPPFTRAHIIYTPYISYPPSASLRRPSVPCSRGSKSATPLVLALTGPTGAGKTETSNLLAEALFMRKEAVGGRTQSQGLLLFRGEDFKDSVHKPLTEYHRRIKSEMAAHLKRCSGRAVVVFDEVQKVIPGTLDVLLEAMSDRPVLTHATVDGVQEKHDCSQVIFVLVSDIGVDSMRKLMVASSAGRNGVEQHKLRAAVKKALDNQWERLHFGKAISEVVAFLPFAPEDIKEIVQLKFEQLAQEHSGKFWRELKSSPGLFKHLAGIKFISYEKREEGGIFAKYGARNVVNGGPLQLLKAKLMGAIELSANEDGEYSAADPGALVHVIFHEKSTEVELSVCASDQQGQGQGACVSKWRGKLYS